MKAVRIASVLVIIISTVFILFYLKDVLIPFVLAVIIWFVIRQVQRMIGKLSIFGKRIPTGLRTIVSFLIIFGVLTAVVNLLAVNIRQIQDVLPEYEEKLMSIIQSIGSQYNIDLIDQVKDATAEMEATTVIRPILDSLTSVIGNAVMILIYVAFLLLEEAVIRPKIKAMSALSGKTNDTLAIVSAVDKSMARYLSLKSFVSLLTGIASFIILNIIGVDFAFFWAFLIFLLNYIPNVGSLIGTAFPAVIALVQFDTFGPALWVLVLVGAVQLIVGNVVEPRMMGNTLNVSPLVVILSLAFWGSIWGVVGMILSVPIIVMMVIIMAQFEQTKMWAILLSEKGNLQIREKA